MNCPDCREVIPNVGRYCVYCGCEQVTEDCLVAGVRPADGSPPPLRRECPAFFSPA